MVVRILKIPEVLWRAFRNARSLTWALRREYVIVFVLGCASELALRLLPLRQTAKLFRVSFDSSAARAESSPPIDVLPTWAVDRVRAVRYVMRHWPVDGVCLRDSLVAGHRLRALHPKLKLGVARSESGVAAHAWLEVDGRSLDPSYLHYAELPLP